MGCDKYQDGYEVNHYIANTFGDCIYTERQMVSFSVGMLSIFIWMIALMPQLWLTFRSKKPESVSLPFLVVWVLGDFTGLAGAILTDQLSTQIYLAWYFLIVCILLMMQNIYYSKRQKRIMKRAQNINQEDESDPLIGSTAAVLGLVFVGSTIVLSSRPSTEGVGRSLLTEDFDKEHWKYWLGLACAYLCAIFYVGSRIPQIMLNFKRKATDGLSLKMFCLGVLGNMTYVASILIYSTETDFLIDHLPFLLNSAPTLLLDAVVLYQSKHYRRVVEASLDVEGEKGYQTFEPPQDFEKV
eukprot:TRINITY_DN17133_c0_g1_i1.p1 TRINITY_DN17133_c0_g1~~TRINITY_DN17133_c0_g1_i1.p1  ORF type:complete len:298 (-),score=17.57 TRINITY_DN17133_c0_g1_i1:16-909(-)